MRRAATAELIKFGTSTPWADVVIYLKRHPNWSKGWGGVWVRIFAYLWVFYINFCGEIYTFGVYFFFLSIYHSQHGSAELL